MPASRSTGARFTVPELPRFKSYLAAAFLGATNPPLDAARLDIIHPRVWGRAEAVRTVLRDGADAAAPLLFGFLSVSVLGKADAGLQHTFLLMLVPLFVAASITLVWGRRTYPRDVAAAGRSFESDGHGPGSTGN